MLGEYFTVKFLVRKKEDGSNLGYGISVDFVSPNKDKLSDYISKYDAKDPEPMNDPKYNDAANGLNYYAYLEEMFQEDISETGEIAMDIANDLEPGFYTLKIMPEYTPVRDYFGSDDVEVDFDYEVVEKSDAPKITDFDSYVDVWKYMMDTFPPEVIRFLCLEENNMELIIEPKVNYGDLFSEDINQEEDENTEITEYLDFDDLL